MGLGEKGLYVRNNARLVFARLEVRVGEKEKDLAQLALLEKVGQKLHGIGADDANVLVAARHMTRLADHALILATLLRVLIVGFILALLLRFDVGFRGLLRSTLLVC